MASYLTLRLCSYRMMFSLDFAGKGRSGLFEDAAQQLFVPGSSFSIGLLKKRRPYQKRLDKKMYL